MGIYKVLIGILFIPFIHWYTKSCIVLGRIIRPADVAASVGFLLSDSAAMLTGSFIELHPEYAEGMQGLAADEAQRV